LYEEVKRSASVLKSMSGIVLRKEKKAYNRVMKRTALVEKGVVTLKGNVACEISSNNHEILLTHLLFSGYFSDMTPIEIASVLTSLVHE
jgi:ATP-dependent RNA helicase DOB1